MGYYSRHSIWSTCQNVSTHMEYVSERFNQQYPDEIINVYVKIEDGFELLYAFLDGSKKVKKMSSIVNENWKRSACDSLI